MKIALCHLEVSCGPQENNLKKIHILHVNESLCCTPEITQYCMKIIFQLKTVKSITIS